MKIAADLKLGVDVRPSIKEEIVSNDEYTHWQDSVAKIFYCCFIWILQGISNGSNQLSELCILNVLLELSTVTQDTEIVF